MSRPRATFALRITAAAALGALGAVCSLGACGADTAAPADDRSTLEAGPKKEGAPADDAASPSVGVDASGDARADADAAAWPTCDSKPASVTARTIPQIWQADPASPTETWVTGAYVSAISGSGCTASKACQLFIQSDLTYPSLAAAAKQGIKVFISAAAATHFTSVLVGDQVDLRGWAWRYNVDGQHELLLQVNTLLSGCVKTTSTDNVLVPLSGVTLGDLTVDLYENTHGPLLLRVAQVLGKPDPSPTATFGLFHPTDAGFPEAGADAGVSIVSLSPFMLTGSTFTGLAPAVTSFASITAVFGLFVPAGGTKYLELYPRTTVDLVVQ